MQEEKHILVVDDADGIRAFLSILLQSEGYTVHEAATALEGMETIRTQPVDMVTLDLGLPDMDGLEVLKNVKQEAPGIPVAVLSVRNDSQTRKTAHDLGAEHYLSKPFEAQEVLEVVHKTLEA